MPLRISQSARQRIRWNGSFFVNHSLALVNRELALALHETGRFDLEIDHFEPPTFGAEVEQRFAPLAAAISARQGSPFATIRHRWPPDFTAADGKLVLIQPWEFGALPKDWIRPIAERVDEVWAYTGFVRDEYLASGVPGDRVAVVPCGVNTARFHPAVEPIELPTRKQFKFLFVGGTIARKGIDVLLDAYSRAFTAEDDVSLIIKDFGAGSFYAGQDAGALIAALQAQPGAPEIVHLTQDMSEAEIAGLYAACDCLAHPYRGEGYGLPIAEAMACAKPVVVTGYGAALDFATARNSYLVPAKVVRLPEKRIGDLETVDFPYWAEPDREALTTLLRHVYENPAEARGIGRIAAEDIAAKHTWRHAALIAAQRLDAMASARVRQRSRPSYEERKQEAIALTRAGQWQPAIEATRACLAERSDDWDLVNALSVALFRAGRGPEAKRTLLDAIKHAPDCRDLHHNLAFVLLGENDGLAALRHAMKALALTPDSVEARRTLERAREMAVRQTRKERKAAGAKATIGGVALKDAVAAIERAGEMLSRPVGVSLGTQQAASLRPDTPARATISVVMIVKDEERFIRECLESVRGQVDEIVVVDTGSTDRTPEIATELGAKVIRHAWNDDFAEARNVSLDHATGNWALWLDADERLKEGDGALLRYLVENAEERVGGYMVNIRNFMQTGPDSEVCWHRACRLFRRLPQVRFTGRIHEQNMRSLTEAGFVCAMSQLTLDHHGYSAEVMEDRNKHERFIRMLTREVEENPDPFYRTFHLFNLANAYYTKGEMEQAAEWFAKAAEDPNPEEEYTGMLFVEWATALYATNRPAEALSACDQAESIGIRHPGIEFARGHACLHQQRYAEAAEKFQLAIETAKNAQFAHTGDAGAYTYKAWYGLGLAMTGLDRYVEAAEHCTKAVELKADFGDARYLLANSLRRLNRLAEAREQLETLVRMFPAHEAAAADLGRVLYDLGEYAAALPYLKRAAESDRESFDLWFRAGSAAEKAGQAVEAAGAYEAAVRVNPHSAAAMVNLGRARSTMGDRSGALDVFADAIRTDPEYANAYFNAADELYKLGAYREAAESLYAGLSREPSNASGFFVLGNCCFQMRDHQAAAIAYNTALQLRPDYAEARSNLALAERMAGELAAA